MTDDDAVEILLVEDDPSDAELTLRALGLHHLADRVVHVTDGQQALDFLFGTDAGEGTGRTPRVVFLDLKLPRVSGIEVLERIRADERTRVLPVVVLTSSTEERDLVEAYRLGVNSYVAKPVDFARFIDAVKDIGLYWMLLNRAPPGVG
jgi:CheY-like chemotaxis protein